MQETRVRLAACLLLCAIACVNKSDSHGMSGFGGFKSSASMKIVTKKKKSVAHQNRRMFTFVEAAASLTTASYNLQVVVST